MKPVVQTYAHINEYLHNRVAGSEKLTRMVAQDVYEKDLNYLAIFFVNFHERTNEHERAGSPPRPAPSPTVGGGCVGLPKVVFAIRLRVNYILVLAFSGKGREAPAPPLPNEAGGREETLPGSRELERDISAAHISPSQKKSPEVHRGPRAPDPS